MHQPSLIALDPKPNSNMVSVRCVHGNDGGLEKQVEPEAYAYFAKRGFTNKFMNKFLKWVGRKSSVKDQKHAASHFLKNFPEVVD